MSIKCTSKFKACNNTRKIRILVILLAVILISSLLTVWVFTAGTMHVKNEKELIRAIDTAIKPRMIKLDNDIVLTRPLVVSTNKDITLTSNANADNVFFKLVGTQDQATINLYNGGVLHLAGIIVTHKVGEKGIGVSVNEDCKLFMIDGEISGNHSHDGARFGHGGGVAVYKGGSFEMTGGVITGNSCPVHGGGVGVQGFFSMSGNAVIANNTAHYGGGGVHVSFGGTFNMSGNAVIANNTAVEGDGGGVFLAYASFNMASGTKIVNNTARYGGGVYITSDLGVFEMLGGKISGNFAEFDYGGVCNKNTFNQIGGTVSENKTNGKHPNG